MKLLAKTFDEKLMIKIILLLIQNFFVFLVTLLFPININHQLISV